MGWSSQPYGKWKQRKSDEHQFSSLIPDWTQALLPPLFHGELRPFVGMSVSHGRLYSQTVSGRHHSFLTLFVSGISATTTTRAKT